MRQRHAHTFNWPTPPFRVVLVEPEIPPNTGNIARLCAATGSPLHLIEPLGFQITDRSIRRAGLDYWPHVQLHRHANWEAFIEAEQPACLHLFSTVGQRSLYDTSFTPGAYLVFGSESQGLSDTLLSAYPDRLTGIPTNLDNVRSLNLSSSVGIALYEALRQQQ